MKLLTEDIKRQLPALYSQEGELDPLVIRKLFDPVGSWTWYAYEGSPVDENGYYDTDHEKSRFSLFRSRYMVCSGIRTFLLKRSHKRKAGLDRNSSPADRAG